MLQITKEKNFNEFRIKNIGFIFKQRDLCSSTNCPIRNNDELIIPLTSQTIDKTKDFYNDTLISYHIVKELFNQYSARYRDNFNYSLSYIMFLLFDLGNLELALVEIEAAKAYRQNSLSEQFIYFLLKDITNDSFVRLSDFTNTFNTSLTENNWNVLTMLNVLKYDKLSNRLKSLMYSCLDKKRQLWKLFESEDIFIEDVYFNGHQYFELKSKVQDNWKHINEIADDHPDKVITRLYCAFLSRICYEDGESEAIYDKKYIEIFNGSDELFNNRFVSDTGVILIECNKLNSPGTITYVNQSLLKISKYTSKKELVGNNLSLIQPEIIGRNHNKILKRYFDKGKSNIFKRTLSGLVIKSKDKYLLPIHLLISFLPSFGNNLEGIGIVRKRQKQDELIITDYFGRIDSMTEKVSTRLHIIPEMLEKKSLYYIQTYFPDFMKIERDGLPSFFRDEFFGKKMKLKINIYLPSVLVVKEKLSVTTDFLSVPKIYSQLNTRAKTEIFGASVLSNTQPNLPLVGNSLHKQRSLLDNIIKRSLDKKKTTKLRRNNNNEEIINNYYLEFLKKNNSLKSYIHISPKKDDVIKLYQDLINNAKDLHINNQYENKEISIIME